MARAHRAITHLVALGRPVSFRAVSREAGVSTSFLYSHGELKARIVEARGRVVMETKPPQGSSEGSAKTKLEVVLKRLREVEQANAALEEENAILRGELIELRRRR